MLASEILKIVNGIVVQQKSDADVQHISIDSRHALISEETLFIAIKGVRNDGHRFIKRLYEEGVRNFIVSQELSDVTSFPEATIFQVKNTLEALQSIAAEHRKKFSIPIVGITGSNGKTVIKEWLFQLLSPDQSVVRNPKSYNSQVGVPLSVWQIQKKHEMGLFEAGISMPNEMKNLERILKPNIGILSNVREAHIEHFKDRRQLAAEKLKLFISSELLIYCSDYKEVADELLENPSYSELKKLSWSKQTNADLRIISTEVNTEVSKIIAEYNGIELQLSIPFNDEASIENCIHCWLLMLHLGYKQEKIAERISKLVPVAMRLEMKQGIHNCLLINDSYNSDLSSLNIALDFLNQQNVSAKKTLILSDIYQSGKNDTELYQTVAKLVSDKQIDRFIGIGEGVEECRDRLKMETSFYTDTKNFLENFSDSMFKDESILLKGSREFEFEKIEDRLQQKTHETVLEINLNSIVHNFNYFKSQLKERTKVMVMVKASSYGTGNFEVANILQYNRADSLSVAYVDEGVELRDAGINLPIMVLNPELSSFNTLIRNNLEPEVYSFRVLNEFLDAVERNAYYFTNNEPYPIHIKLDTGMHRLGFEENDIAELIKRLKENGKEIRIKSIFSHLSSSDQPENDDFTYSQISLFTKMSETIMKSFDYQIDRHILNSNGILRFPEAQFDMVRLGIGLYGVASETAHQKQLKAVTGLKTVVSQVKQLAKGESVGYSRNYVLDKDAEIATIPIGYADGLSRSLGNGCWQVGIKGKKVPIVGNVCMDMCMIDVTGLNVNEGDLVVIFEEIEDLYEMSSKMNTIPYELYTNISTRVKRVFYHE